MLLFSFGFEHVFHSNPFRHEFWQIVGAFCTLTHTHTEQHPTHHYIHNTNPIFRSSLFEMPKISNYKKQPGFGSSSSSGSNIRFNRSDALHLVKDGMHWTWNRFEQSLQPIQLLDGGISGITIHIESQFAQLLNIAENVCIMKATHKWSEQKIGFFVVVIKRITKSLIWMFYSVEDNNMW